MYEINTIVKIKMYELEDFTASIFRHRVRHSDTIQAGIKKIDLCERIESSFSMSSLFYLSVFANISIIPFKAEVIS